LCGANHKQEKTPRGVSQLGEVSYQGASTC
jgi:hypothetical protein